MRGNGDAVFSRCGMIGWARNGLERFFVLVGCLFSGTLVQAGGFGWAVGAGYGS